jgi:hypothetical protein
MRPTKSIFISTMRCTARPITIGFASEVTRKWKGVFGDHANLLQSLFSALDEHPKPGSFSSLDGLPRTTFLAVAIDGKKLCAGFDAFSDRTAAHMMSALRHADVLRPIVLDALA